jgi:hypothetical protein
MNIQRSEKIKVIENYGTAIENRMSIYLKRFLLLNSASKFRPEHAYDFVYSVCVAASSIRAATSFGLEA